ncbi:MAG: flagellin [Defluviitaleaceae bacterium]|nr:flagellin [Defluviitaleaceae bacterium]
MSNLVVRTNMLALNSHRHLGNVARQQAQASARLSSGFRINSAADDASGLGVSENMRAQISGLNQARRNALDGISLIQTAEGGLDVITDMVRRVRELSVQAANDTYTNERGLNATNELNRTNSNRSRIQSEIDHLIAEIGRQGNTIEFNNRRLLDGSNLRSAATAADRAAYDTAVADFETARNTFEDVRQDYQDAREEFNELVRQGFPTAADEAAALADLQSAREDFEDALTDFQDAFTDLRAARQQFEQDVRDHGTSPALWFQVGANSNQRIEVTLPDIHHSVFRELEMLFLSRDIRSQDGSFQVGNIELGAVSNGTGAEISEIIDRVDVILSQIVATRGDLGAIQNRFEFTIDNLAIASENLTEANSRIRDTDMAEEMMRLTQANILQQAATAMLAQGNQAPQSILQLLG